MLLTHHRGIKYVSKSKYGLMSLCTMVVPFHFPYSCYIPYSSPAIRDTLQVHGGTTIMTQSYHLYDISVEQEGNSFQVYVATCLFSFHFHSRLHASCPPCMEGYFTRCRCYIYSSPLHASSYMIIQQDGYN